MDQLGGGGNRSDNQLNLRDFGPGRTLVLVNGLRRANYPYPSGEGDASFNWNRIPIGIVERIEILTSIKSLYLRTGSQWFNSGGDVGGRGFFEGEVFNL